MAQSEYRAIGDGNYRARRPHATLAALALLGMVLTILLSACGPDASQTAAQQSRARLDAELHHASAGIGIPSALLAPVTTREIQVAASAHGSDARYQHATASYNQLYQQVLTIERTALPTLQSQTQHDVQALSAAVQQLHSDGFIEVSGYQTRLATAQQQLAQATTVRAYATVDAAVQSQLAAAQVLQPTYTQLEAFNQLVSNLQTSAPTTVSAQAGYTQDLTLFRQASTADQYHALAQLIAGQTMQLAADETSSYATMVPQMLRSFQARLGLLKQYGESTSPFDQQYTADAQRYASSNTLATATTLVQQMNSQMAAMALPLAQGKASTDIQTLQQLITFAQAKTTVDPANGQAYPDAYEYADPYVGIGDAQQKLQAASSVQDYQQADVEITQLTTNLRAMLQNLADPTPHSQPHATDLALMRAYGMMTGRVIVVSLREQTARLYDNGKMVYWSYVTTGGPQTPSVPGVHYVMQKQPNMVFTSPDPKNSPLWYAPTPIHYALLYANYGYYLHDAWWRSWFGPYSNLPHYDPAAFNGGSHGCINFPLSNMPYVYNWAATGVPVIVY